MSYQPQIARARSTDAVLATNKVIRNTYTLLSMTLLFSAVTATVSIMLRMPPMTYLVCVIGGILLGTFVLPRFANSSSGIGVIFGITGLLGFGLGPVVAMYLQLANGPQIVATALGGTGAIFLALSGYALTTRKDFSFMAGFLGVGMMVVLVGVIANLFLAIPAFHLALSAVIILLMSGLILFYTSRLIHGGETNYISATFDLYMAVFNIFIMLLQLLGFAGGDD